MSVPSLELGEQPLIQYAQITPHILPYILFPAAQIVAQCATFKSITAFAKFIDVGSLTKNEKHDFKSCSIFQNVLILQIWCNNVI